MGVPAEAEGEIRTGLRWQQQGDTTVVRGSRGAGGRYTEVCVWGVLKAVLPQVVPVPAPGRRSLARKEVKSTLTHYRVLGAAGGCALLQLQPRTGEWPPNTPPCALPSLLARCHPHLPPPPPPRASPAFPEQLPVHLTLLLCPALGDHKHSSRVGRVLGVPFLLPPEAAPTRTQVCGWGGCWGLSTAPRDPAELPSLLCYRCWTRSC